MRVALTLPYLVKEFGGPATKATHLAQALRAQGCHVEVVGCGYLEGATSLGTLGRFHSTPIPRRIAPIGRAVGHADIVHILGYRDPVGTVAARHATRHRTPYVLEPVGMYGPKLRSHRVKQAYERLVGASVVKGASRVVATSHIEEEELLAAGMERQRVVVRPNGVHVKELLPLPPRGSFRDRLGIPRHVPLVLTIGRISLNKGLLGLVHAAAQLDDAFFVVAGPDNLDGTLETLRDQIRDLRLQDRFSLLVGGIWGVQKREALADADCFCLPSETESFGIAAAEAAAVGVPVVLSDRCGAAPWLVGGSVLTFTFGDPTQLAASLRSSLTEPGTRSVAEAGAPGIRRELNWDTLATQQISIYRDALASSSEGA